MPYETLSLAVTDGIATLTPNRADALDMPPMHALFKLSAALKEIAGTPTARCLVLPGAGRGGFQRTCIRSADFAEARTAFAETRKPVMGRSS